MVESLVLIESQDVDLQELAGVNLMNAKQLVIGRVSGRGAVLHLRADSSDHFRDALIAFAQFPGVKGVMPFAIWPLE